MNMFVNKDGRYFCEDLNTKLVKVPFTFYSRTRSTLTTEAKLKKP